MRSLVRGATPLLVLLAWLSAGSPAVAAERVCGTAWSGGSPVRGAHVVATERGLVALTDSTGGFCFEEIELGTITLLVAAIGFQPAERLVSVGPRTAPVHFELVPLRGGAGASAADQGSTTGAGARPGAGPAPSPAAAPEIEAAPPAATGPAGEFLTGAPVLVLPADSAWLVAKHKEARWATLLELHAALVAADGGPKVLDPRTWRSLGGRVHDFYVDECALEGPRKRSLSADACAYLERANDLTDVRAALLAGKPASHDTRVHLGRLASSSDARVSAWAKTLLAQLARPAHKPAAGSVPGPDSMR